MQALRAEYYSSLKAMRGLLDDPMLIDNGVGQSEHNQNARILRSGIMVSAFSHLEHHMYSIVEAHFSRLPNAQMAFDDFSENLKKLLVFDGIRGLPNRAKYIEDSSRFSYIERQLVKLSSYRANPRQFSDLGFSPLGSNILANDISVFFSDLGVKKVWKKMTALSQLMGGGSKDVYDRYDEFLRWRNECAHRNKTNVPTADAVTQLVNASIIAIAFDILLSKIIYSWTTCSASADVTTAFDNLPTRIKVIDPTVDGRFAEKRVDSARATKIYDTLDAALAGVRQRRSDDFIVSRNRQGVPEALD